MKKIAWTAISNAQQLGPQLLKYGPPALAVGAGGAGIVHLMAKLKELQDQREARGKAVTNDDTLTVQIPPPKVAGWFGDLAAGASKRWAPIGEHLGRQKWRYGIGTALALPTVGATLEHMHAAQHPPPSLMDAASITAILAGGGLLGYHATDRYLKNQEEGQMKDRLDRAKNEYSTMLGQTLSDGKTAAADDPNAHFPFIIGACLAMTQEVFPDCTKSASLSSGETAGSLMLGGFGGLSVLSAILAHKWMYNRQKELANLYLNKKPRPPKQIRLVSAPTVQQPEPEQDVNAPLQLEAPKVAGLGELPELVGALAVGSAASGGKGEDGADPKKKPPVDPAAVAPPATAKMVGPGTAQISTSGGPVEVTAEDPAAAAILQHGGARKITQLMSMMQASPTAATPEGT